ncbi:MAG: sigma-70 family RNA polymerase sigma factor [Alicyclobacillus sp.]|nr:sigma-70 family RNA polymerase sigma factor [Alicyclobacillus sp.]
MGVTEWGADRDGAEALLASWMEAYGADVLNFAYSYLHNYHLAQDVTQDVFLRAFQHAASFRGESSVKTWLLSITANRCRDHLRSWSAKHELYTLDEQDPKPAAERTEQVVLDRIAQDEVWQMVLELPVKYREVVVLYYFRDLSTKEIAEALDATEEAIRTRLHRARSLLRQRMERDTREASW